MIKRDIVAKIAAEFRTFGGGRVDPYNPISLWTQDRPLMFAMGVDVAAVVARVLRLAKAKAKASR